MQSISYKLVEFMLLFIVLPISLALSFLIWIKLIIGVLGFAYIIFVLLKVEKNQFRVSKNLNWKVFWKETFIKLIIIAIITIAFVWFTDKDVLFNVIINKPKLWIIILFFYSLFSVYPQELIYRTFFFQRYQKLFSNHKLFIFVNAIVFSLAHFFFRNSLVILLTFLGGLLFALTFNKTKSTLLVSIEHAIYGSWLFTVGMGEMLAFPS
ncbi:MAG: CPBP family intramembrane metalloprotease [Flavobacteriaceae bacterium]|nr:CPBP family intramembrane metalloprotease [Flavobacteriaceae bacterium]